MTDRAFDLRIEGENEHETNVESVPEPDGGRAATLFLVGCSILQLPIWGFVMSYGVLQDQYTAHFQFQGSSRLTGVIGTTLNGALYISLPFLSTLFSSRLARWRRTAAITGLLISSTSLIISASSTAVWHLILTQGVLCGLGSALVYSPTTLYLDEWFIRRKSFAYGVLLASKNIVGTGTPFLTPALLSSTGLPNTLRIWGAITLLSGVPAILLIRPRIDVDISLRHSPPRRTPWKFLTHSTFYIFHFANIVFSSGYGLPQTYLPSYARQVLHLPTAQSSLMLALFNLPGIISCIAFGMLGDGVPLFGAYSLTPFTITFLSAVGSALPVFLLWGLAARSGVVWLALFSSIYGFFAGAYSATWGGVLKEMRREAILHNEAIDTGVVYSLLNGGRGLGFVVGGLTGVELLNSGAVQQSSRWGYGTEYGAVILYTGVSAVIGGWSVLWRIGRI